MNIKSLNFAIVALVLTMIAIPFTVAFMARDSSWPINPPSIHRVKPPLGG